jgi:hypothetical protein
LQEIAEKLSTATNKKITYIDTSPLDFKQILIQSGVSEWFAEALAVSWQIASEGNPIITNVVAKVGGKQPITFDEFVWDHKAVLSEK